MPIRNSDGSVKKTTDRGYGWDHQKKREEVLKGNPKCHWCKKAKATQADHVGNRVVPSCAKCNNDRSHKQQVAKHKRQGKK